VKSPNTFGPLLLVVNNMQAPCQCTVYNPKDHMTDVRSQYDTFTTNDTCHLGTSVMLSVSVPPPCDSRQVTLSTLTLSMSVSIDTSTTPSTNLYIHNCNCKHVFNRLQCAFPSM